MKKIILLLGLFFIALLSACGATGPKYQSANLSNSENSLIYIYRPSHFVGAASYPDIILGGKLFARSKMADI